MLQQSPGTRYLTKERPFQVTFAPHSINISLETGVVPVLEKSCKQLTRNIVNSANYHHVLTTVCFILLSCQNLKGMKGQMNDDWSSHNDLGEWSRGWSLHHSTVCLKRLTNTIKNLVRLPGISVYITPCRCFTLYLDIRLWPTWFPFVKRTHCLTLKQALASVNLFIPRSLANTHRLTNR